MEVDLTNYEVGDLTSYFAWCTHEGCPFVTDDYDNEAAAVQTIIEHLEDDHSPVHDDVGDGRCKCGVDGYGE